MAQNFGKNTVLNQALAKATGYTGNFGNNEYGNWLKTQGSDLQNKSQNLVNAYQNNQTGVVPVGAVEPLNDWQKKSLSTAQAIAPTAADFGQVKSIFSNALSTAMKPQDPANNPYLMSAIDAAKKQSLDMRARLNPQMNQNASAMGAFGSSRDAIQRAEADRMIGSDFDNRQAQMLYDAYWREGDQNRASAAAQQSLGNSALGLYDYGAKSGQYAGDRVQSQNQALVDAANKERLAAAGYDQNLINWYLQQLGGIQYPTTTTNTGTSTINPMMGALGGGLAGAGIFSGYTPASASVTTNAPTSYGPWFQG